jgi:DNA-directed RNA polymerase specialized sigma24 family protein
VADTDDLVQETVIQAFRKLDGFDYRGEGALLAYLRQALLNRIRSEIRKSQRRPAPQPLGDGHQARGLSPLEQKRGAGSGDA